MRLLVGLVKRVIFIFLRSFRVRRVVVSELREHFPEDFSIDLWLSNSKGGLRCPLYNENGLKLVFAEIFLDQEYKKAMETIPLPKRWLDIGCNVGYFSLWLAELRRKQCLSHDFSALCIDADSRAQEKIGHLIRMNRFQDKIFFKQGAISLSKTTVPFVEAHHMPNSSVAGNGVDKAKTKEVEVITAQRIYDIFPPPYDLIKLDIEGSEYDFFAGYDLVLRSSKFLVFEGHISTQAADRLDKCKELLKDKNFELIEEYKSFCGIQNILLYKNNKPIAKIS